MNTEVASRLRLAIVRTSRRLRQEAYEAESGAELSPTLTAALATIDRHGPLTPSELAERESIRRPTATRSIATLQANGLVARTADPSDRRGALISTTAEGRALLKRLRGRKNAYIAKRLRTLDDDEIRTLDRAAEILERMLEEGAA
ncbi:MAG: MarR family winged helix-turn-helix transcriptional regulator [Solirubrobacterales bacterium]